MKKIYLGLGAILLSTSMIAQNKSNFKKAIYPLATTFESKVANESSFDNQRASVELWGDNFDDPSTWVIDNGTHPAPYGWAIDQVNKSWAFNAQINSSSGGNNAEFYNGDPQSGTPAPVSGTFTLTTA